MGKYKHEPKDTVKVIAYLNNIHIYYTYDLYIS